MSEIKQTNFRIDQDTADAFRKFCEANGMNQAQGFDHVMQIVEMDLAKAVVPNRAKDIEDFELHIKKITAAYMNSIEDYSNVRESVREQFASALDSKDKTIRSLQEKAAQLQAEKETAEATAVGAAQAAAQAVKDSEAAKAQAETASKLASEKDRTIATLADKLSVSEEKAAGYDDLRKSAADAVEKASRLQKDHETEIRELKLDFTQKMSLAEKDAALSISQAVAAKEREMNEHLRAADMENARLQAKIELLEAQIRKLTGERAD